MDIPPSSSPAASAAEDFDQTIKVRTPAAGAVYFNRYRLTRVLGRGGMGVVWLADDLKLERPVALKFLPSLIGLDPTAIKELKTETRRGLELSHPNIVRIYDFVDDDDEAAISMEFVDGKTLSELRATTDHGVFTTEQVSKWLPGVCEALDYAHIHRKVVHRDLKPSNIMAMSLDDTAKIADFGIARSISDTMQRLSISQLGVSGTLPYMSPQQAMGERPSPTDDVYSLGATIYELLSGKPPFYRGDIPSQLTSKIPSTMHERREELEIKASDRIPKEWEAVIAACLHKDPSMRPQSAGKVLELLGLKSTTNAATQPFIPPVAHPKSRIPVYAAAAIAVLAAGAAFYFKTTTPNADPAIQAPTAAEAPSAPVLNPAPAAPAVSAPVVTAAAPVSAPDAPASAVIIPQAAPATTPAAVPPPVPVAAAANVQPTGSAAPGLPQAQDMPATAGAPASALPAGAMIQPPVSEPPEGYWSIQRIFPTPPQTEYSEAGRRHLLYEVQRILKEKSLYSSTQDGKEGKGTHNAIILYQAKNGLLPNGLLDGPTLTSLSLMDEPDEPEWSPPSSSVSSSSSRRKSSSKDEPNLFQRAGKSIGRFFKRD